MNPLNPNVTVNTYVGSGPRDVTAFNNLLILTGSASETAFGGDVYREYITPAEALTDLDATEISQAIYDQIIKALGQSPRPAKVLVAACVGDSDQNYGLADWEVTLSGTPLENDTATVVLVYSDGTQATATATADATPDLSEMAVALASLDGGQNSNAVVTWGRSSEGANDTENIVEVRATSTGGVTVAVTKANSTERTAQLTALLNSDAQFYVVVPSSASQDHIALLGPTFAAAKKQLVVAIPKISGTSADYAPAIASTQTCASPWYHGQTATSYATAIYGAAVAAVASGTDPDVEVSQLAYKKLSGIAEDTSITSALKTTLQNGQVGMYTGFFGTPVLWEGKNCDGEYFDAQLSIHWTEARMAERIAALLVALSNRNKKLPYTDSGIQQVAAVMDGVLKDGVKVGHFAELLDDNGTKTTPLVSPPRRMDVSASDITNRILRIPYQATIAGSIQQVVVNGYITTSI